MQSTTGPARSTRGFNKNRPKSRGEGLSALRGEQTPPANDRFPSANTASSRARGGRSSNPRGTPATAPRTTPAALTPDALTATPDAGNQAEPSTEVKALRFEEDADTKAEGQTALWGAWELWCDLSPAPGRSAASATAGRSPTQRRDGPGWTWLDDVKSIGVFDTAEGFWGIHNCIKDLSAMEPGTNLYLLRRNIPPMWEHEANRRGGRWSVVLPAADASSADALWLALRLAAIGETFPGRDVDISGVTASRKRHAFRISVWTRFAHDVDTQMAIGRHIRDVAGSALPPRAGLTFTEHAAALVGGSPISRGRSPLAFAPSTVAMDVQLSRSCSPSNENIDPPTPRADFPAKSLTVDTHTKAAGGSPVDSVCGRSPPSSPNYAAHQSPGPNVLYSA